MSSKRPLILTAIMLALLLGYLGWSYFYQQPTHPMRSQEPPRLYGKNTVSNLKVQQTKPGVWTADFDYFYTGEPRWVALRIDLLPLPGPSAPPEARAGHQLMLQPAQRGTHHVSVQLPYPRSQESTHGVEAKMLKDILGNDVIVSQSVDQAIDWPDFGTWYRNQQMAFGSREDNLKRAVALIDSEDAQQLTQAKSMIEQLIAQDPKFDEGYVQLARIALKSSRGPEALHQAEGLLSSALQIQPDNAHAKVLLGQIYTHQNRFPEAEALFVDVAQSKPSDPWLWTDWGDLLAMEKKPDQAIAKYREAIALPMKHDRTDRGRAMAYVNLIGLLQDRKDLDGMEALYKQRITEFGPGSCYASPYARFKLQVRGDTQGAIDLARGALNQDCEDSEARQLLGLAEYVKWAGTTGAERDAALNEARIFLPAGPTQLYLLATSDRTVGTAKKLLAAGEKIDQVDDEKLTALAYALREGDVAAAKRLLALGARPDRSVGYAEMPVALAPVMEGNIDAVRLLQRSGVDYSKLRFRGVTAVDIAKQLGNRKLLEVLTGHGTEL